MTKNNIEVKVKDLKYLPKYTTINSSGADLKAAISEDIVLDPNETVLVPTGVYLALPEHLEAQVRPRSGLALKYGVTVLNTPGTIDADYRGEIKVILINHGKEPFVITKEMRIAQIVIAPYVKADFNVKNELNLTLRNTGGFGHSGTN